MFSWNFNHFMIFFCCRFELLSTTWALKNWKTFFVRRRVRGVCDVDKPKSTQSRHKTHRPDTQHHGSFNLKQSQLAVQCGLCNGKWSTCNLISIFSFRCSRSPQKVSVWLMISNIWHFFLDNSTHSIHLAYVKSEPHEIRINLSNSS